jgi:hypothetical protein
MSVTGRRFLKQNGGRLQATNLDVVQTNDAWLCAVAQYTYGEDILVKIETKQNQWNRDTPTFYLEVPDAHEIGVMQNEFQSGNLAISDLKSYCRTFTFLQRRLRDMRKAGLMTWVA